MAVRMIIPKVESFNYKGLANAETMNGLITELWRNGRGYKKHELSNGMQNSTAEYVEMDVFDFRVFSKALVEIINKGAESLYYKVYGFSDRVFYYELVAETSLAAASRTVQTLSDAYPFLLVLVKSNSGVTQYLVKGIAKT